MTEDIATGERRFPFNVGAQMVFAEGYRAGEQAVIVMPKQCNHCWCEESSHPDHVQCCKCRDYMHVNFAAPPTLETPE